MDFFAFTSKSSFYVMMVAFCRFGKVVCKMSGTETEPGSDNNETTVCSALFFLNYVQTSNAFGIASYDSVYYIMQERSLRDVEDHLKAIESVMGSNSRQVSNYMFACPLLGKFIL